jgi:flap endonuclease-1
MCFMAMQLSSGAGFRFRAGRCNDLGIDDGGGTARRLDQTMGVLLTPLIVKETVALRSLAGRRLAVDTHGELYQFLALIRQRDGVPLMDGKGRVTSHLVGLFFRTTRLVGELGLELVFVFDGPPPPLKAAEIDRRRRIRDRYEKETTEARAAGDLARAYSKATMTSRLTREMVGEARELLRLLGIPTIEAPGEGEAQAAFMAGRGDAWAAASKDYDALLFGAPRLLRFLTLSGREFLPSTSSFRPITPELIVADSLLAAHGISRPQLVDLAILVGTDFNAGIKDIGPKKALQLVRRYGAIEEMPDELRLQVPEHDEVRRIYLEPRVTTDYAVRFGEPDEAGIVRFLCEERAFGRERVMAALGRMRQRSLFP